MRTEAYGIPLRSDRQSPLLRLAVILFVQGVYAT